MSPLVASVAVLHIATWLCADECVNFNLGRRGNGPLAYSKSTEGALRGGDENSSLLLTTAVAVKESEQYSIV